MRNTSAKHKSALHKKRNVPILLIDTAMPSVLRVVSGCVFFFLVILMIVNAFIISYEVKQLEKYLTHIHSQTSLLGFQIQQGLNRAINLPSPPCSQEELSGYKKILADYYFLGDIGRLNNDQLICTAKNNQLQPTSFPKYHAQASNGMRYWNDQNKLFVSTDEVPIMGQSHVVIYLSTALLVSIDKSEAFSSRFSGAIFTADKSYVLRIFGKTTPSEVQESLQYTNSNINWLPFSNKMSVISRCADQFNLCTNVIDNKPGLYGLSSDLVILIIILTFLTSLLFSYRFELFRVGPNAFVRNLKRAVSDDKIWAVYQPKVDIQSGKIKGVESLARWGDVSPEVFIAVAEEFGFIKELTFNFIRRALSDLKEILESDRSFSLGINIAPELLENDQLLNFIKSEVASYQISNNQIILEITERTTSNSVVMSEASKHLKQEGFIVSLDDFGTGLSNLAWLTTFEPNEIKVDKMFTQAIGTETVNNITLHSLFNMLDTLNVQVVFEGIETQQQLDYIKQRIPTAIGQGYFFAKPLGLYELQKKLRRV